MTGRRARALLALLLYVGIGLATPLADAFASHRDGIARALHIEAAGEPGCHHHGCVLDAPGAPQAPAVPPASPVPSAATHRESPRVLASQDHDRTPIAPLGARAPPRIH